jgi:hypothetical protein
VLKYISEEVLFLTGYLLKNSHVFLRFTSCTNDKEIFDDLFCVWKLIRCEICMNVATWYIPSILVLMMGFILLLSYTCFFGFSDLNKDIIISNYFFVFQT